MDSYAMFSPGLKPEAFLVPERCEWPPSHHQLGGGENEEKAPFLTHRPVGVKTGSGKHI